MRSWFSLALVLVLGGCPSTHDTSDTSVVDTGTTDTGTDTGSDTGTTDTGTTDTATNPVTSVAITADAPSITTRQTVTFTVQATYADSTVADVTSEAALSVDDDSILKLYQPPVGQPLHSGTVTVTAEDGGEIDTVDIDVSASPVAPGELAFNEILADGTVDGDPNGDGSTGDGTEEEFVEIVNLADVTVSLAGVTLTENDFPDLPRHTFPDGVELAAGSAVVLFGGGSVGTLSAPNAQFYVAENDDPGIQYGLSLRDLGDTIILWTADSHKIVQQSWGDAAAGAPAAVPDASLVLQPEVTGADYADHSTVSGAVGAYSPGRHADGTAFPGPDGMYSR